MTDLFYNFLVKNNILFQFIMYIDKPLTQYMNEHSPYVYMMHIGNWNRLKEGGKFWVKLHNKWAEEIRQYERKRNI